MMIRQLYASSIMSEGHSEYVYTATRWAPRGMTSLRANDSSELVDGRGDLKQGLQVCSNLVTVEDVAVGLPVGVKCVRSVSNRGWNIQTGMPSLKVA